MLADDQDQRLVKADFHESKIYCHNTEFKNVTFTTAATSYRDKIPLSN